MGREKRRESLIQMKDEALDYRYESNYGEKPSSRKCKLKDVSDVAPCQPEGQKPQKPSVELCCVLGIGLLLHPIYA